MTITVVFIAKAGRLVINTKGEAGILTIFVAFITNVGRWIP